MTFFIYLSKITFVSMIKETINNLLRFNMFLYFILKVCILSTLCLFIISAVIEIITLNIRQTQLNQAKIDQVNSNLRNNKCYDLNQTPYQRKICDDYKNQLKTLKSTLPSVIVQYINSSIGEFIVNLNYSTILLIILTIVLIRQIRKIKDIF